MELYELTVHELVEKLDNKEITIEEIRVYLIKSLRVKIKI